MKVAVQIADHRIRGHVISEGFQTLYNRACERMAQSNMMDETNIVIEFADGELRLLNPKTNEVWAAVPATPVK